MGGQFRVKRFVSLYVQLGKDFHFLKEDSKLVQTVKEIAGSTAESVFGAAGHYPQHLQEDIREALLKDAYCRKALDLGGRDDLLFAHIDSLSYDIAEGCRRYAFNRDRPLPWRTKEPECSVSQDR